MEELPTTKAIATKLNQLVYYQKRWPRANPNKLPEINAIFAQIKQCNEEEGADESRLRLSIDTKASVKFGPFAPLLR